MKKQHKYLIIIGNQFVGRFDGNQVCICNSRNFPAKTYTRPEANEAIKKSKKFRVGLSPTTYSLLRVED